jgi:hypothetical protein
MGLKQMWERDLQNLLTSKEIQFKILTLHFLSTPQSREKNSNTKIYKICNKNHMSRVDARNWRETCNNSWSYLLHWSNCSGKRRQDLNDKTESSLSSFKRLSFLWYFDAWECVSELWSPTGLLFIPQITSIDRHGGMISTRENWRTRKKNVPQCHSVHHGLTRARTRNSAVRGQRLTVWAMARLLGPTTEDLI